MKIKPLIFIVISFLIIDHAYAGEYTPPVTDSSVEKLAAVFGSIITSIRDGGSGNETEATTLGTMISVLNAACLFVGMLFTTFISLRSIVDSAESAEVLGKKMSSAWVPIRMTAGASMLLPLSSGYSAIQVIVIWCVLQGVGIADKIWSAGIEKIAEQGWIAPPILPETRKLAAIVLRSEVCAGAMNATYAAQGLDTKVAPYTVGAASTGRSYEISSIEWRASSGYKDNNICGGVTLTKNKNDQGDMNSIASDIQSAQIAALQVMISDLQPIADKIVAGDDTSVSVADINKAADAYTSSLAQAVNSIIQSKTDGAKTEFLKTAQDAGWIYAGTWFPHLSHLNDALQSAMNAVPVGQSISITSKEAEDSLVAYKDAISATNALLASSDESLQNYTEKSIENGNGSDDLFDKVIAKLSAPMLKMLDWMTHTIGGSNLNHVSQMKSFGDGLIWCGVAFFAAIFGISGVAGSHAAEGTAGWVFDGAQAIASVSPTLSVMVISLFGLGIMLAVYMPLIPWVTWMTSVVNWFVLVIEAIIVAPIWAAAHIAPDGHDVVGRAAQGYSLLFSVIFRPALMIFGFYAGFLLTEPVSALINSSFMTIVSGTQAGSMSGMIVIIGYTCVYVSISITVTHLCYSLIHWVPDNCLRWIASATSGLTGAERAGDDAKGMMHKTTHTAEDAGRTAVGTVVENNKDAANKPENKPQNSLSNSELM